MSRPLFLTPSIQLQAPSTGRANRLMLPVSVRGSSNHEWKRMNANRTGNGGFLYREVYCRLDRPSRLPTGDTADWQSALRGRGEVPSIGGCGLAGLYSTRGAL